MGTAEHPQVRLTPGALRILDTASELFYRHGIHAVGVDTIAAASGVTKRTLYDRFGSKDTLVAAYLERRHDQWWSLWAQRIEAAPRPRALTVFDSYLDDAPTSDRGCAFLNAAAELPGSHPAYEVVRRHKWLVRERLEELVAEDPGVSQPGQLAEHLFLLLEGAVAHRGLDGSQDRLTRARSLAAQLLGGPGPG
ncbi:TetR/AcrR family transcriptional regulator [Micrococcus sp. TA1]|uniref:TetR/AcrR family transcriptional regulator n=1 Tax=Micrococcus sp. TA1 TaxID=681627 RepID=UPI00181C85E9|nr:AcrR family transcriptional regulator [Micrococcus sp. TA1]